MSTKKDVLADGLLDRAGQLINLYESNSEFGRITGLNRQTVALIKNKEIKNLSFNTIVQIIKGTGCSSDWFILNRGKPFAPKKPKAHGVTRKEANISLNTLSEVFESEEPANKHTKEMVKAIRDMCDIWLRGL